jgi:hypothetical protein
MQGMPPKPRRHTSDLLIRWVVSLNVLLVILSWFTWFGGNTQHAGVADRIFGQIRFANFRADFVWLIISTGALGFVFFYFLVQARRDRQSIVNALLCLVGIVAFCVYIFRALTNGTLDFG